MGCSAHRPVGSVAPLGSAHLPPTPTARGPGGAYRAAAVAGHGGPSSSSCSSCSSYPTEGTEGHHHHHQHGQPSSSSSSRTGAAATGKPLTNPSLSTADDDYRIVASPHADAFGNDPDGSVDGDGGGDRRQQHPGGGVECGVGNGPKARRGRVVRFSEVPVVIAIRKFTYHPYIIRTATHRKNKQSEEAAKLREYKKKRRNRKRKKRESRAAAAAVAAAASVDTNVTETVTGTGAELGIEQGTEAGTPSSPAATATALEATVDPPGAGELTTASFCRPETSGSSDEEDEEDGS